MFDIFQLIGGIILAFGYIPQIVQLIKTRSSKDLSLKTYLMLTAGITLMEIYAVDLASNGSGQMFLVTNSISLLLTAGISVLVILLRRKEGRSDRT